jgi:hypothetical protein
MTYTSVTLIALNNEASPGGMQVWGQAERGRLRILADYEVKDVSYFAASLHVTEHVPHLAQH